jgi:hypothetical protein
MSQSSRKQIQKKINKYRSEKDKIRIDQIDNFIDSLNQVKKFSSQLCDLKKSFKDRIIKVLEMIRDAKNIDEIVTCLKITEYYFYKGKSYASLFCEDIYNEIQKITEDENKEHFENLNNIYNSLRNEKIVYNCHILKSTFTDKFIYTENIQNKPFNICYMYLKDFPIAFSLDSRSFEEIKTNFKLDNSSIKEYTNIENPSERFSKNFEHINNMMDSLKRDVWVESRLYYKLNNYLSDNYKNELVTYALVENQNS